MKPGPILPARVAAIALTKIGLRESPSGSNRGPEIQEFFDADDYDPNGSAPGDSGYAWCASFVCRIIQLAMEGRKWTFTRPTTPGAFDLIRWSREQDSSTNTKSFPHADIKAGDIIIYTFSHAGIAVSDCDSKGYFTAAEGNTNKAGEREGTVVLAKRRHYSEVRSRIRFTV